MTRIPNKEKVLLLKKIIQIKNFLQKFWVLNISDFKDKFQSNVSWADG